MINERFVGMLTSVSAGVKPVKAEDGTKMRIGIYKVKLESASIDYDSIAKFNPYISATLLNVQPMPFKAVNFGDQSAVNMMIKFYSEEEDASALRDNTEDIDNRFDASYGNVMIKNLTVNVKENIPVYVFTLEIPMHYDGKFLFSNLKSKISFEFDEMAKREVKMDFKENSGDAA